MENLKRAPLGVAAAAQGAKDKDYIHNTYRRPSVQEISLIRLLFA